jgi:hypothetical protein
MNRVAGADTAFPVTQALIDSATKVLGGTPPFWGRYFGTRQTGCAVEYRHALEDGVLSAAGICVLPIACQTNAVGGTAAQNQRLQSLVPLPAQAAPADVA